MSPRVYLTPETIRYVIEERARCEAGRKACEEILALCGVAAGPPPPFRSPPPSGSVPTAAHLAKVDLERDQFADLKITFTPRDWTGPSYVGLHLSDSCSAFCEALGKVFLGFEKKARASGELTKNGKPVADYKLRDAARCQAWAERLRAAEARNAGNGVGSAQHRTVSAADEFAPFGDEGGGL